jgi:glycosyltransferase involved in cell wall biosynthesis
VGPNRFVVTVAIPAYNEGTRIAGAIASAKAQTEPPAEILVIDDGSTDDTAAIARSLGARVISQPNAGVSAARNRALREADQPWIAFCDADDVLLPEKLAFARLAHESRPEVDFIFSDYRMTVGERTTVHSTFALVPDFEQNITATVNSHVAYFDRDALARALAGTNFILPSTVVVRRAPLLAGNVFFAIDLPQTREYFVGEDLEWFLRVLLVSDALALTQVLTEHRRKPGSLSEDSGRMKYGDVKLGELIAASPLEYAEGAAESFARNRRRHVRESAGYYLRALRFPEAHAKLREAQRIGFRGRDELLAIGASIATLPGALSLARIGRRTWSERVKPVLRVLARRRG